MTEMSEMETINPQDLVIPVSSYSHGIAAGDLVFVAGQVSFDEEGDVVGVGDLAAQTCQAIANVEKVLRAAGARLSDVVSTTVYLTSFDNYADYDRAYGECFGGHRPARATVKAELVKPELLVEVQAIAVRKRGGV